MSLKVYLKSFFIFIFLNLITNSSKAQVNGNSQPNKPSSFELDLGSSFGGVFYEDQIGLQLASTNRVSEGIIDTSTYQLGPNDLISIDIEGTQPILMRGILVNTQGDIVLPIIGTIHVNGETIVEAQKRIKNKVAITFKDPSVKITLEQPRPAIIHIRGDIPHPGKYIIPAQSRVDFAIYQSLTDGIRQPNANASYSVNNLINKDYSFRNVEITHLNGNKEYADLISYYRIGDFRLNPFVRDGDIISIQKSRSNSSRISISGSVNTPSELEFLESDTPLSLLNLADGFSEGANTLKLLLIRKEQNGIRKIELSPDQWNSTQLLPNDRLIAIPSDNTRNGSSAWISGEVNIPGNFPIREGKTTVYELVELAGNLTDEALPQAAYLIRNGSIENEIPNKFNTELLKRTSDQIAQGMEYLDLESKVSRNRVFIDLKDDSQLKNVKLYDGDKLFIPRDEKTLFIFGQVNNPGYYPYSETKKSVLEYISSAGGFALAADEERIFILKAGIGTWYSPQNTTLQSGDKIFVDRIPYDELNAQRTYQLQRQQLKNTRIQLIMTGLTTITSIVTAYVAITRN